MARRINFSRFNRLIVRSAELAAEPGMNKSVVHIHTDQLAVPGGAFTKAHAAVKAYESAWKRDSRTARKVLEQLNAPYRTARSAVLAYEPDRTLPDTLKAQQTDTDKLLAIEDVYSAVVEHAGEGWADDLLKGEFGTLALEAKAALETLTVTAKALAKARDERMTAYLEAYDRFMAFKRVVRDALGSSSKQYHRIHLRSRVANDVEPEDITPEDITPPSQKTA